LPLFIFKYIFSYENQPFKPFQLLLTVTDCSQQVDQSNSAKGGFLLWLLFEGCYKEEKAALLR
jgi:hypothetical protein